MGAVGGVRRADRVTGMGGLKKILVTRSPEGSVMGYACTTADLVSSKLTMALSELSPGGGSPGAEQSGSPHPGPRQRATQGLFNVSIVFSKEPVPPPPPSSPRKAFLIPPRLL